MGKASEQRQRELELMVGIMIGMSEQDLAEAPPAFLRSLPKSRAGQYARALVRAGYRPPTRTDRLTKEARHG